MTHIPSPAPRGLEPRRRLRALADPLFQSSFALMANTGLNALTGFVFWSIASHRVPAGDVGLVTTTVGLTVLCGTLGTLGFPNGLIRYLARNLPRSRAVVLNAALITQASTVVVTVVLWLSPLRPWASSDIGWAMLLTVTLMQLTAFTMIVNAGLLAMRLTGWIVAKNVVAGVLRIGLVLPAVAVTSDAAGLLAIQVIGSGVACGLGLTALRRRLDGPVSGPRTALAGMGGFTAANYAAMSVGILPMTVSAPIVLHVLGREEAAYFSISLMIVGLLSVIASSISQSMFAEAQRDTSASLPRRATTAIVLLLVPSVVVAVLLAPWVLGLFGPDYAEQGTTLLRWMSLASLPAAICYFTDSYVNGRGDGRGYLLLNVQNSAAVMLFVAWGATHDLTAVGMAWCAAQTISAAFAVCYVAISRRRWPTPSRALDEERVADPTKTPDPAGSRP